jgi:indole-3-glycerol phosphate synthase
MSCFLGELGVENDLDQDIPELFAHVRQVQPVDRIEQLAAFIDKTARERLVGLLLVPRAASRPAQAGDGVTQLGYRAHWIEGWAPFECRDKDSGLVFAARVCFVIGVKDKLSEIMAWKRREIAPNIREVPEEELVQLNASLRRPASFIEALRRPDGKLAVIAEIKRRSPSAGEIAAGASSLDQAETYRGAGADAMSILTDLKYFGGTLDDLRGVTDNLSARSSGIPCLRKDFMVHPIQVLEARQAGASAILIIVRALTDETIHTLHKAAKAAGLDALFEVHAEDEIKRAEAHGALAIGVNNRDLAIFKTDLGLSERLIGKFPRGVVAVSESGINTQADAARAHNAGAHAVLVGEALMRSQDPAALIASFRSA